jgi:DNA-binding PadR family transcriptional regulator
MDVRTICLGLLTRGDATGYDIKKLFDGDSCQLFVEASFGSIYPALNRMTEEGLVSVREEPQEKRPDRKVYSITETGRAAFLKSLNGPLEADRYRSAFMFAMLFSDLLPASRVDEMLSACSRQIDAKLAQINAPDTRPRSDGERFTNGLGRAVYTAMRDYLNNYRAQVRKAEAAE